MQAIIDSLIQKTTMYKLTRLLVGTLMCIAIIFGFAGVLPFSGLRLLISSIVLLTVCWLTNQLFAKLYSIQANGDASFITAFILFFLFSPPTDVLDGIKLAVVGVIAMVSKYVIAYRARHIFNPAAFAAVVSGFAGLGYATWWVATASMTPFVIVAGLLILRKVRRTPMFVVFYAGAFTLVTIIGLTNGLQFSTALSNAFISWPLLFLGMVMLTEPLTTPPTRQLRMIYAVIVALLLASQFKLGPVVMSPEIALVLGNIYAYTTTLRQRVKLRLLRKIELAPNIFELVFKPERPFTYHAGQYVEVGMTVPKQDIRGNRRTFTIASAPSEPEIKLGIKFVPEKGSAFKRQLQLLPEGGILDGVQVAGDFILPAGTSDKLLFIAGGIGITPFRSQLQWLVDTKQTRDIVLLYSVADPTQAVYKDVLQQAKKHGVKVFLETGIVDEAMVQRVAPDHTQRIAYVSGPPPMVSGTRQLLKRMGIKRVRTDFFSGY